MKNQLISLLEHHPEHYVEMKLFGETYKLCSRCLGRYLVEPVALLVGMLVYYLTDWTFDFNTVFIASWLLAGLTILDWSSVEIFHIRKGSNKTRMITGGTLAISISLYIWILPATWSFKLFSLAIYFFVIWSIIGIVKCKKNNINPLDEIRKRKDDLWNMWDMLLHPKKLWLACNCCPCCCSTGCCCGGTTSCCPCMLCCLSCCLPLLCCPVCTSGLSGNTCGSCGSCGGKKGNGSGSGCGSCGSCGSCGGKK